MLIDRHLKAVTFDLRPPDVRLGNKWAYWPMRQSVLNFLGLFFARLGKELRSLRQLRMQESRAARKAEETMCLCY